MTLNEFIAHEVKLALASKLPNRLSARFAELHLQPGRGNSETDEYQQLHNTMRTRWRWHSAMLEARQLRKTVPDQPGGSR